MNDMQRRTVMKNRYFNVENTTVVEQAETAGACAGFIAGAAAGAKIASNFWWLGPVAYPTAIIGGTLTGGAIGAIGGANLGKAIVIQMNAQFN
jgi:phage tail tape-measure protein